MANAQLSNKNTSYPNDALKAKKSFLNQLIQQEEFAQNEILTFFCEISDHFP